MIVVSDTSPLTNLAAIKQFNLLSRLYEEVHLSTGVWDELNEGGIRWPGSEEVASADWICRHDVQNEALVISLMRDLDRAEAESIALSLELKADLILLDEKEGRRAAQRLGLRILGVVSLLLEAKALSEIERIRPHLDALRQAAGSYLSESLYRATLDAAGEI